jgi:hypothetical protein
MVSSRKKGKTIHCEASVKAQQRRVWICLFIVHVNYFRVSVARVKQIRRDKKENYAQFNKVHMFLPHENFPHSQGQSFSLG